jgi:hypothetical protein
LVSASSDIGASPCCDSGFRQITEAVSAQDPA